MLSRSLLTLTVTFLATFPEYQRHTEHSGVSWEISRESKTGQHEKPGQVKEKGQNRSGWHVPVPLD